MRAFYLPSSAEIAPGFPWVLGRPFRKAGFRLRADHVAGQDGKRIASRVVQLLDDGREELYNWSPARAADLSPPDVDTRQTLPTSHQVGRGTSGPRPAYPRRWLNAARLAARRWWGRRRGWHPLASRG